jgi:acyl carrier protein
MDRNEVFERVVKILTPHVKETGALATLGPETHILDELGVNSARLVDIVLEFEDVFEISIGDDEVDAVETVGQAVDLITAKLA